LGTLWSDWISRGPAEFAEVYATNRDWQKRVRTWISQDTIDGSLWKYGMFKERALEELNAVEMGVTYTDVLAFFSRFLARKQYLEIGVSAGKNFFQMSKQLANAKLVGFDIESINPVLESRLGTGSTIAESANTMTFATHDGSVVERTACLREYHTPSGENTVQYLSGDKFRNEAWSLLDGNKFTLVFSDACHRPESLETEMAYMVQHDLIDRDEMIMVWDDLDHPNMFGAFRDATRRLSSLFPDREPYLGIFDLHGSYAGETEGRHRIGVFVYDRNVALHR
jgi:hypothetical protein